jgi:hypothetical protein
LGKGVVFGSLALQPGGLRSGGELLVDDRGQIGEDQLCQLSRVAETFALRKAAGTDSRLQVVQFFSVFGTLRLEVGAAAARLAVHGPGIADVEVGVARHGRVVQDAVQDLELGHRAAVQLR